MTDVRDVFISSEVSRLLDITPAYLIRLAKSLDLNESEFRETAKGSYLFNQEAIIKIRSKLKKNQ